MIYIERNNKQFGPYDTPTLLSYVNNGQVLLCDTAREGTTGEMTTVRALLKKAGLKPKVRHEGDLVKQLGRIGSELIIPKSTFVNRQWLSDKRLLLLAIVGLFPSILMLLPTRGFVLFYLIALYFSAIWGVFFYYFFKTSQVYVRTTVSVFFLTQVFVFLLWDVFGLVNLNPMYYLTNTIFPFNLFGYILGVGLTEEFAKMIPLLIICRKSKEPLVPQTLVYYGLMSGIAFGVFEGVQYQMTVNTQLEYSQSFFMNIARLTSLPFLHAIWCGIAGYFISFAKLYPKYRKSLYFLAIAIPAILHGIYDTFCNSRLGMIIAIPVMVGGVVLLMTYLKQGINYQSKLRN